MSLRLSIMFLVFLIVLNHLRTGIKADKLQYMPEKPPSPSLCCHDQLDTPTTYIAAVYEHDTYLLQDPHRVLDRNSALELMKKNLKVFEDQARLASKQGAQIIVFPEDGIYGMGYTRQSIFPFLEEIPDPSLESWNPCVNPDQHSETEVLRILSCIARNNSIVVVANMGDKQNCSRKEDPNCPNDSRYQFNTDVAFDNDGQLLAKYHKYNLFYENQFDAPPKCEHVKFTVFSVTFGMFTCFDILFKDPSVEVVEKLGVKNVVFPTAWGNALPLRHAIQYHQAWAMGENVNLLSANQHHPFFSMTGSGIYSGQSGALVYYHDSDWSSGGKLLIARVPTDPACNNDENFCNKITENDKKVDYPEQNYYDNAISKLWGENKPSRSANLIGQTFQSKLEEDIYTFSPLKNGTGQIEVCDNALCCQLDYSMSLKEGELYAFGAFDGLHTFQGQYYLQVCVLLKCHSNAHSSCGTGTTSAGTAFSFLHMAGNFSTSYVYPEVTTDGVSLAPPSEWKYEAQAIRSTEGLSKPLLSAGLYGRWYDRD
ncbi:PREDICTED: vascular non-inflammatory molecule 3-like [Branchiostoma belcheri]|uniref:Biotinidase n=1 Tax=Branchiostoma belcheri TaxID=7741 RepID=A0A6P4ZWJ4_BRABE|nr:PREDICTED: vascular non-inflammatory molecule 3-like [Branchiostoma belcheri]